MDHREFWRQADAARDATLLKAETWMQRLSHLPIEEICKVLIQYRYFGLHFIGDLAILISKMPAGELRSFLGQILAEELGDGQHTRSHPFLYDAFLDSLGVPEVSRGERWVLARNRTILREVTAELGDGSAGYGIGLRGMGGECLCQTYLIKLWEHFRGNPHVKERAPLIDWRFWDIHVGPVDTAHVEQTRARITDFVLENPTQMSDLFAGYRRSIDAWDHFWENAFTVYASA